MYLERMHVHNSISQAQSQRRMVLVTGIRRSGKTALLRNVIQSMRSSRPPIRIVHIEPDSEGWTERRLVNEAKALGVGPSALVIDNAERIGTLTEALAEIERRHAPWMLISGIRTQQLEEILGSRFAPLVVRVSPFSYPEFLSFTGMTDSSAAFSLYTHRGGLPENLSYIGDESLSLRIRALAADSFILTEILENGPVRNPRHLKKVLSLVVRYSGENLPARQICAALAADRISISPQSAVDYLDAARKSGLIVPVPAYDISKRKILETGTVRFCADTGFREPFLAGIPVSVHSETDHAVENCIFLSLQSSFDLVYRGRVDLDSRNREEVSFVCEGGGKRVYIQIIGSSTGLRASERKKKALLSIRDGWKKILVSNGPEGTGEDGILTVSPRKLLLGGIPDQG